MGQQFLLTSCWMCDLRFCPHLEIDSKDNDHWRLNTKCAHWKLAFPSSPSLALLSWILSSSLSILHPHYCHHCNIIIILETVFWTILDDNCSGQHDHHRDLSDQRNGVATVRDGRLELFLLTLFIQLLALRWNFSKEFLDLKYLSFDEDILWPAWMRHSFKSFKSNKRQNNRWHQGPCC